MREAFNQRSWLKELPSYIDPAYFNHEIIKLTIKTSYREIEQALQKQINDLTFLDVYFNIVFEELLALRFNNIVRVILLKRKPWFCKIKKLLINKIISLLIRKPYFFPWCIIYVLYSALSHIYIYSANREHCEKKLWISVFFFKLYWNERVLPRCKQTSKQASKRVAKKPAYKARCRRRRC